MTKRISIHENKDCFFVFREVISADQLPVSYWPVYRIDKEGFEITKFADAIDKSFRSTGETISDLFVGADGGGYDNYIKKLVEEFGAKSLRKLQQSNKLFQFDKEGDTLDFLPTVYKKGGYYGDEDNYGKLYVSGKTSLEIGQEMYNLIQVYHKRMEGKQYLPR